MFFKMVKPKLHARHKIEPQNPELQKKVYMLLRKNCEVISMTIQQYYRGCHTTDRCPPHNSCTDCNGLASLASWEAMYLASPVSGHSLITVDKVIRLMVSHWENKRPHELKLHTLHAVGGHVHVILPDKFANVLALCSKEK